MFALPEAARGSVIDALTAKSFEHLLKRLDDFHVERLGELAGSTTNPERRLRLWAAAHKARAGNNVARRMGNIGAPVAMTEVEYDDGNVGMRIDDEAETEIRQKLTADQLRNRKRHFRRQTAAETTQAEVDDEVKLLMAKSKKGQLTVQDVDQLRERKDLEYQIELDSNINLTAEPPSAAGDAAHWTKNDLTQVQRTLARLPHAHDPDGVTELHRVKTRGPEIGAQYNRETASIDVTDSVAGTSHWLVGHDGDKRELVSDRFRHNHGDTIGAMEFTLTHEFGHDVHAKDAKAFAAFQKAAGWRRVKVDALRADGVSEEKIEILEKRRLKPSGKVSDFQGRTYMYQADSESKDLYWALPITAIPAPDEAAISSDGDQHDSWSYARSNRREHFAEMYAKAVHVPTQLYDDLVKRPGTAAAEARNRQVSAHHRLDIAERIGPGYPAPMLANLRVTAGITDDDLRSSESARDHRAAEFEVMRNTVFHTDQAVQRSVQRLRLMNVSAEKIQRFQESAAAAATPEQVTYLEAEASR